MPTPDYASGRPVYLQIADDLRARIGSGEYPTGDRLPSNKAMSKTYGVAAETVRQALDVLRHEKLIGTQSTRGTFVIRQHGEPQQDDLQHHMSQLRDEVRQLTGRVDVLERDGLRAALERLELSLMDLYGKLGFDYPREDTPEDGAPSKAVAHGSRA